MRGTAQNPDVYFQGRETVNRYYLETPGIVQRAMDRFAELVGRPVPPVRLRRRAGRRAGGRHDGLRRRDACTRWSSYLAGAGREGRAGQGPAVPAVRRAALSWRRCRRASARSPCSTAPRNRARRASRSTWTCRPPSPKPSARRRLDGRHPPVVGGRYGLGSKEFTAGMAKAVFDNLSQRAPKNHFTVGIIDDVTGTSLAWDDQLRQRAGRRRASGHVLRLGRRRHGGRQQELDQDHRQGHRLLRPGLFRLRLEEVRLDDRFRTCASAPQPIRSTLSDRAGRVRGLPLLPLPRAVRHAQPPQAGRRPSCSTAPTRPTRSGISLPMRSPAGADRASRPSSTSSTPTPWPSRLAWADASTSSCRRPSSPSPACCPKRRRWR